MSDEPSEPRCALCAMKDGEWGRHLELTPSGFKGPMHTECIDDLRRYGCD